MQNIIIVCSIDHNSTFDYICLFKNNSFKITYFITSKKRLILDYKSWDQKVTVIDNCINIFSNILI